MKKFKGRKFSRKQLVFAVETMLVAVRDTIEQGLLHSVTMRERENRTGVKACAAVTEAEHLVVQNLGLQLGIFAAQITGEGLGEPEALQAAGRFDELMTRLILKGVANQGEPINRRKQELLLAADPSSNGQTGSFSLADLYGDDWPDCHKIAKKFVDQVFGETGYLKSRKKVKV